jgi:NAD(P)-dependent dehydrogenase (short-subunit alcohol dehydrogenase family)
MRKETMDLTGAVVAITGGARGIGQAMAYAFARKGAKVAIGDLDHELGETVAAAVGGGAIALALDVTDRASVDRFVAQIQEQLGPIDVFINNAGIGPVSMLVDESDAFAERIFAVNVHGTLHGMKAVLPGMLERGSGHIVNISSGLGKIVSPGAMGYCATKHAVVAITETARLELRSTPIQLSLILPGIANTELASGVKPTRGVKLVEPDEVATAVVKAVENQNFEVFVPRSLGPVSKLMTVLPRPVRDQIARALRTDRLTLDIDPVARQAYHDRTVPRSPKASEQVTHS